MTKPKFRAGDVIYSGPEMVLRINVLAVEGKNYVVKYKGHSATHWNVSVTDRIYELANPEILNSALFKAMQEKEND